MTIKNVPTRTKNAINSRLAGMIKKHGLDNTRIVVNHYFKNVKEMTVRETKIAELERELSQLKKKK